jgi:hypothetical protein
MLIVKKRTSGFLSDNETCLVIVTFFGACAAWDLKTPYYPGVCTNQMRSIGMIGISGVKAASQIDTLKNVVPEAGTRMTRTYTVGCARMLCIVLACATLTQEYNMADTFGLGN